MLIENKHQTPSLQNQQDPYLLLKQDPISTPSRSNLLYLCSTLKPPQASSLPQAASKPIPVDPQALIVPIKQ